MVNFVSLKIIIDRILRNPILRDVQFEKVIDDCVDFLEILRIPITFVDKFFEGTATDYRLELPCDIGYIKQVLINNKPVREATDTFHHHYHCLCIDRTPFMFKSNDMTMTVQDGYLFTSEKCCNVKIAYMGIKTDDEGYPMIPDHRSFMNALEKYIEWKHLRMQWQNGKIADKVYEESTQEYSWAAGQCETAMRNMELPKAESLFNMWQSLLINNNQFAHRLKDMGAKQLIKKH